jgi:LEA14-like dessication related protein
MKLAYRSVTAAVLVAMVAAACANPQQPEVRVEGMRLGAIGLRGGTLIARVFVSNPNSFAFETRSLTYHLQVADPGNGQEWISFAEGTYDERVRVEGRGSTVIEVPIQFRYDHMGGAIRSIMDTGSFNYRVTGDVRLSEPIGRTFPYRRTGTVSLDGVRE